MRHTMVGPSGGGTRALCAVLAVFGAGCITRTAVYDDIYRNRNAAYQAWKSAKEGREGAQPVLTGKLSIQKAVNIAWENNKLLGAIRKQRENAKGRIIEAYSAALPKLDLQAGYTRLDKVPTFNAPGISVPIGNRNNYSGSLVLTQPFFQGGIGKLREFGIRLQPVPPGLEGPNRLEQGFLKIPAHRGNLADGLHRRSQSRCGAGKFLEGEPGHLDDDVIQRRFEGRRSRPRDVVDDLVQPTPQGDAGREPGDREPGRLGG